MSRRLLHRPLLPTVGLWSGGRRSGGGRPAGGLRAVALGSSSARSAHAQRLARGASVRGAARHSDPARGAARCPGPGGEGVKTALVTGGAGFIGSNVVRLGLQAGWSITVLDNFSAGYVENLPDTSALRVVRGDVRDRAAVDEALRGIDAVFHLAASVGNVRSIENPLDDSDVNVLGTLQLLEGMRRAGVRRLVFSSSAAIFGEPRRLPIVQ